MRRVMLLFLVLVAICATSGFGLDFEITKVVELGPVYSAGKWPLQWSESGEYLAFLSEGHLVLADTLGNIKQVAEIELPPNRFAWTSDSTIIVFQRQLNDGNIYYNRLSSVNINSGEQEILEEFEHRIGDRDYEDIKIFRGPFYSVEGNAYYHVEEHGIESIQMAPNLSAEKAAPENNHLLKTHDNAVYLVQVDFQDSIKISPHPFSPSWTTYVSPDWTHVMSGGTITRLSDSYAIILDTMAQFQKHPDGMPACGFSLGSFNPKFTEVLFRRGCDDGHFAGVSWVGILDYSSGDVTILDSLVSVQNCNRPAFSPGGSRIAFISHGTAYYLDREVK